MRSIIENGTIDQDGYRVNERPKKMILNGSDLEAYELRFYDEAIRLDQGVWIDVWFPNLDEVHLIQFDVPVLDPIHIEQELPSFYELFVVGLPLSMIYELPFVHFL